MTNFEFSPDSAPRITAGVAPPTISSVRIEPGLTACRTSTSPTKLSDTSQFKKLNSILCKIQLKMVF